MTENAPPQRWVMRMGPSAGNVVAMKRSKMRPRARRGVVVHVAGERHHAGAAAGQQPVVGREAEEVHEVARVL